MAEASGEKPKVILHWLSQSRAQRFVWLLEECKGMEYEIKTYSRGSDMLAPKDLKLIHPLGKSPVITVQSPTMSQPLALAESGAIAEYLCDYFAPHLIPKRYQEGKDGQVGGETETWIRYRYYMHYAEGSLMTLLLIALLMDSLKNAPVIFLLKPILRAIAGRVESQFLNENMKTHFGFLESQLKSSPDGGKYICGKDLTAADIMLVFPLTAGRHKIDAKAYPTLTAYTKMLEENDGYKSSIKKIEEATGEPFSVVPSAA